MHGMFSGTVHFPDGKAARLGLRAGPAIFAVMTMLAACSNSAEEKAEKQRECEGLSDEIRRAAAARGTPSQGACNNPSFPEGKPACDRLAECNRELAEM